MKQTKKGIICSIVFLMFSVYFTNAFVMSKVVYQMLFNVYHLDGVFRQKRCFNESAIKTFSKEICENEQNYSQALGYMIRAFKFPGCQEKAYVVCNLMFYQDEDGDTILHVLAEKNISLFLRLVLDFIVLLQDKRLFDLCNTQNKEGRTPLAVAKHFDNWESAALLIDYKQKVLGNSNEGSYGMPLRSMKKSTSDSALKYALINSKRKNDSCEMRRVKSSVNNNIVRPKDAFLRSLRLEGHHF